MAIPAGLGSFEFFPGPEGHQPPSALSLRSSPCGNVLEGDLGRRDLGPIPAHRPERPDRGPGRLRHVPHPLQEGHELPNPGLRRLAGQPARPQDPPAGRRFPGGFDRVAGRRFSARRSRPVRPEQRAPAPRPARPLGRLHPDSRRRLPDRDRRHPGDGRADVRLPGRGRAGCTTRSTPMSRPPAHDAFEANRVTGFIAPRGNRWTLNLTARGGAGEPLQGGPRPRRARPAGRGSR